MRKSEMIMYIINHTEHTGLGLTYKSKKELYDIMQKENILSDFLANKKQEILRKYLVEVKQPKKQFVLEIDAKKPKRATVAELEDLGFQVDKIVLKDGHHVCPNCGHIANGKGHGLCELCKKNGFVEKGEDYVK